MSEGIWRDLDVLLSRHRSHGVLLDTNVLLLWLFTCFAPSKIGGKRLEKYTLADGQLLRNYVDQFQRILTTTHILTETSNLAAQVLSGREKTDFFDILYPLFCLAKEESLQTCKQEWLDIERAAFVRLGLTDAALISTTPEQRLILTDDLDLFLETQCRGGHSINFTHMREAAGLL